MHNRDNIRKLSKFEANNFPAVCSKCADVWESGAAYLAVRIASHIRHCQSGSLHLGLLFDCLPISQIWLCLSGGPSQAKSGHAYLEDGRQPNLGVASLAPCVAGQIWPCLSGNPHRQSNAASSGNRHRHPRLALLIIWRPASPVKSDPLN